MNSPTVTAVPATPDTPVVLLCLGATWFIWGSMYLAIKWALDSFPPFYQMGTQFLVAGTLLGAFALLRGAPLPDRRQSAGAAVTGALLLGVALLAWRRS